ncbi:SDHC, cytochrome b subunit of succinate dehydrogenase [Mycena venus]|uniref:SDHC, cytochrome b subunit of succinate dehydrogenase n=1 Tax=Mycena venus TaxID=2733690 RepID=A0A8H7D0I0_9AGAR|nr:SDHC, cytochrome b subunit of succinate dehydrogenase [Mycena venus]
MSTSRQIVGLGPALQKSIFRKPVSGNLLSTVFLKRSIQTQSLPPSAATDILNKQRLLRPTSPHLTIYKPQVTSILSIGNRFVGAALSVLLYGFSLAYLFAPGTFDSAHVVEFIAGLPDYVKYGAKAILAAPFAFHSLNGVRHLSWDIGKFLTVKEVYQTGYTVLAGTAVSTVILMLL